METLEYWDFTEKEPPTNTLIMYSLDDAQRWSFACYLWSEELKLNVLIPVCGYDSDRHILLMPRGSTIIEEKWYWAYLPNQGRVLTTRKGSSNSHDISNG